MNRITPKPVVPEHRVNLHQKKTAEDELLHVPYAPYISFTSATA